MLAHKLLSMVDAEMTFSSAFSNYLFTPGARRGRVVIDKTLNI